MSTRRTGRQAPTPPSAALLCGLILALAGAALAEPEVSVSGQVRARQEISHTSFDADAATLTFTDLRTRLTVDAKLKGATRVVVQLQDSRRLGGRDPLGADQSGTLANGRNVDVHQAYLSIGELWDGGPGLKTGRFEVNLGNQRVFGAVGWHNVGRSWEGTVLRLDREAVELRGFWLKRLELDDPASNRDFDVFGVNATLKDAGAEVFAFLEKDADTMDGGVDTGLDALSRASFGVYAHRAHDALDVVLNAVYQSGTRRATAGAAHVENDIAAYLFTLEAGYTLDPDRKTRLAAGVDLASGDGDPADGKHEAYDNLYYTGHKFRGFMDYFLGSGSAGLTDIMLRGRTAIAGGWLLELDLHRFTTTEDHTGTSGAATNAVGSEIDLTVVTTRIEGATLAMGASAFLPDEDWAGAGADTAYWLYTMFTAGF